MSHPAGTGLSNIKAVAEKYRGAVQPMTTAEKILGVQKVPKPEEESRRLKPVMDEYVPEEKQEPYGRYWMGRDEDDQPKIYFDDPERVADAPRQPEAPPDAKRPDADAPEAEEPEGDKDAKGPERKEDENWECDTDKVDRELSQKDNDTYRRQHSAFTQLS